MSDEIARLTAALAEKERELAACERSREIGFTEARAKLAASEAESKLDDLRAQNEKAESLLAAAREAVKVQHFSSCGDGSCDSSCQEAYDLCFDAWVKGKIDIALAAEREKVRVMQKVVDCAIEVFADDEDWAGTAIPNLGYAVSEYKAPSPKCPECERKP